VRRRQDFLSMTFVLARTCPPKQCRLFTVAIAFSQALVQLGPVLVTCSGILTFCSILVRMAVRYEVKYRAGIRDAGVQIPTVSEGYLWLER
jgi:hypothetical protein